MDPESYRTHRLWGPLTQMSYACMSHQLLAYRVLCSFPSLLASLLARLFACMLSCLHACLLADMHACLLLCLLPRLLQALLSFILLLVFLAVAPVSLAILKLFLLFWMKAFSSALSSKYNSMEILGVGHHTPLLGVLTHEDTHASSSSEMLGHTT